jgi:hypothetical protein
MDKIYIIRYEEHILRVYPSKAGAEKYYRYVRDSMMKAERFQKAITRYSYVEEKLQLIAVSVSQEEDDINMKLGNCHAGGGDPALYYELCPV